MNSLGKGIAIFLLFVSIKTLGQEAPTLSLDEGFRNPPLSARPKALWPWPNGNVDFTQLTYEMEEAVRKSMGGFGISDLGVLVDPLSLQDLPFSATSRFRQ